MIDRDVNEGTGNHCQARILQVLASVGAVVALYGILAATAYLEMVRVGESRAGYNRVFRYALFFFLAGVGWLWARLKRENLRRQFWQLILSGALGGALSGDFAYLTMVLWEHFRHGRFGLSGLASDPGIWFFIPVVSGSWILGILSLLCLEGIRATFLLFQSARSGGMKSPGTF